MIQWLTDGAWRHTAARQAELFREAWHMLFLPGANEPGARCPAETAGRAAVYFPVTGLLWGLSARFLYAFLVWFLDEAPACFLVLLFYGLLGGGQRAAWRQFGGYLADGLLALERGGAYDRWLKAEVLAVYFQFFLFMLKFLLLLHAGKGWTPPLLVILPVFSCWSRVYLLHSLAFTSLADTKRFGYMRFTGTAEFWWATVCAMAAGLYFMELEGMFFLMLVSLWAAICERWVIRRGEPWTEAIFAMAFELAQVWLLLAAIIMRKGFFRVPMEGVWL